METEVIESIKSLPLIPESVRQIQSVCSDANSSIADVVKIVEKDPILTASLLKAANSPLYGFSREVSTVRQAVSLFGMSTIKGFAIVTVVKSSVKIDLSPYNVNEVDFLKTADLQNAFMVRWMMKTDRGLLNLLAPAAFLLEMGVVILSNLLIKKKEQHGFKEKILNRDTKPVADIEREVFGMSAYEATAALFEYWNFEKSLIEVMRNIQTPHQSSVALRKHTYALSTLQNLISLYQAFDEKQIQAAKVLVKQGGFDEEPFDTVLKEFQESMQ